MTGHRCGARVRSDSGGSQTAEHGESSTAGQPPHGHGANASCTCSAGPSSKVWVGQSQRQPHMLLFPPSPLSTKRVAITVAILSRLRGSGRPARVSDLAPHDLAPPSPAGVAKIAGPRSKCCPPRWTGGARPSCARPHVTPRRRYQSCHHHTFDALRLCFRARTPRQTVFLNHQLPCLPSLLPAADGSNLLRP